MQACCWDECQKRIVLKERSACGCDHGYTVRRYRVQISRHCSGSGNGSYDNDQLLVVSLNRQQYDYGGGSSQSGSDLPVSGPGLDIIARLIDGEDFDDIRQSSSSSLSNTYCPQHSTSQYSFSTSTATPAPQANCVTQDLYQSRRPYDDLDSYDEEVAREYAPQTQAPVANDYSYEPAGGVVDSTAFAPAAPAAEGPAQPIILELNGGAGGAQTFMFEINPNGNTGPTVTQAPSAAPAATSAGSTSYVQAPQAQASYQAAPAPSGSVVYQPEANYQSSANYQTSSSAAQPVYQAPQQQQPVYQPEPSYQAPYSSQQAYQSSSAAVASSSQAPASYAYDQGHSSQQTSGSQQANVEPQPQYQPVPPDHWVSYNLLDIFGSS